MTTDYSELGTFSFTYRSVEVHGIGISASSNFAVLYEATQFYLKHGLPLDRRRIAESALAFERRLAAGAALAANDVFPITFGGAVIVRTNCLNSPEPVQLSPINCSGRFFSDHMVVAFDPQSDRHDVPGLLKSLFAHPRAVRFVSDISALSINAEQAVLNRDIQTLAVQVESYVSLFDQWTDGAYTSYVRSDALALKKELGPRLHAWKPPGGGATKSLIAFVSDREAGQAAVDFFRRLNWWAAPVTVTGGVDSARNSNPRNSEMRFTAGHRIDIVGAADLGQDPRINVPGICCSIAVEPRTELVVHDDRNRS